MRRGESRFYHALWYNGRVIKNSPCATSKLEAFIEKRDFLDKNNGFLEQKIITIAKYTNAALVFLGNLCTEYTFE